MISLKDVSLLVFLSQLGLGVVLPLAGFALLGLWLRQTFSLGVWIVLVMTVLGGLVAACGFVNTLKTMHRMSKKEKETPLSFNDHE